MDRKMDINELILYREVPYKDLFCDMAWLMEHYNDDYYNREDIKGLVFQCVNELIKLAARYGFSGNLWHCYLAFVIAYDENEFSMASEIVGNVQGTINDVVKDDFRIFKKLFDYDFGIVDEALGTHIFKLIADYKIVDNKNSEGIHGNLFNRRIRDRICDLGRRLSQDIDIDEFYRDVTSFYKDFGVGKLGLHKAFRICHDEKDKAQIVPITNVEHIYLKDLIGYESQKQKLVENTKNFIDGKLANNVLLFGDSGTGKSSSIKAILNEYYDRGLRMIEVYKHQFQDLSDVIEQIKDRNYKFIIYMDDLSFEEFEIEYKYLKAVIEGGLGKRPNNVLIYATSNRRHLIREKFSDREERDNDLHNNDTVQEKLSLVARFGVTIYYGSPDKFEFENIVRELAKANNIDMPQEQLFLEANKWELSHGGLSGRTARQFVTYLSGKF